MVDRAISVVIIDEQRVFAEALGDRLAIEPGILVCEAIFTMADVSARLDVVRPDIVLLDLASMDGTCGPVVTSLLTSLPYLGVIVIGGSEEAGELFEAVRCGAMGWVPMSASVADLLSTIRGVGHGEVRVPVAPLAAALAERLVTSAGPRRPALDRLTPREREVLACLCEGMSRAEVATRLDLSPNTVRTHVQSILAKLDVRSALAAVTLAHREGLAGLRQRA